MRPSPLNHHPRFQTTLHDQKVQECQSLAAEMDRLKLIHTTLGMPPARDSRDFQTSTSPFQPASAATYSSSSSSSLPTSSTHSAASALVHHIRSISMSSQPTTPAVPSSIPRSHTPSNRAQPPFRHSKTTASRSASPTFRPEDAAPQLPTPPAHLSTKFAFPPSHLPESCRLFQTPTPRLSGWSVPSEEHEREYYPTRVHQRWIPPLDTDLAPSPSMQVHGLARPASTAPGSHGISSAAAQAQVSR